MAQMYIMRKSLDAPLGLHLALRVPRWIAEDSLDVSMPDSAFPWFRKAGSMIIRTLYAMSDSCSSCMTTPAPISNTRHTIRTGRDCLKILLASPEKFLLEVFLTRRTATSTAVRMTMAADRNITSSSPKDSSSILKKTQVDKNIIGMVTMSPMAAISGAEMLSTSHPLLLPA